ncbi:MAG: hypothetical protein ACYCVE_05660 [Gemmatimonadaceae bacterium]
MLKQTALTVLLLGAALPPAGAQQPPTQRSELAELVSFLSIPN